MTPNIDEADHLEEGKHKLLLSGIKSGLCGSPGEARCRVKENVYI